MLEYSLSYSFSPWLLAFGIIILSVAAYLSYKNIREEISSGRRGFLTILRSLAFALLLIILSSPLLSTITTLTEEPLVALFADRSKSMSYDSETGEVDPEKLASYRDAVDNILDLGFDDPQYFEFAQQAYQVSADTALVSEFGSYTNIQTVLSESSELYNDDNVRAAVLISDGNSNQGGNALMLARRSRVPIYTVGFGDTSRITDLYISKFKADRQTPKNNIVQISAEINWKGIQNNETDMDAAVNLYKDSLLILSQSISLSRGTGNRIIDFADIATEEGVFTYRIEVDTLSKESNTKNNSAIAVNTVRAVKKQLSLFAGAPSSDVSFIGNAIRNLPEVELRRFIQKQGGSFYNAPTDNALSETDALVLINFPISSTDIETIEKIEDKLLSGIPMFFIAGPDTDWNKASGIIKYLPFDIIQSNNRELEVQVSPENNSVSKTIFSLQGNTSSELWADLPPLYRTETYVKLKPGAKVISQSIVGNRAMNDALLSSFNTGGSIVVASLGYGFYNWKLNGYARDLAVTGEAMDLFSRFIANTIGYLSVENNSKRFRLFTDKSVYSKNSSVSVSANVFDLAGRPLQNAIVEATLKGDSQTERNLRLTAAGPGFYNVTIDGLQPGNYTLEGKAVYETLTVGTDFAGFSIADIDLELTETAINKDYLKAIAQASGGKYYDFNNISSLYDDINSASSFRPRSQEVSSVLRVWDFTWLLILTIAVFATEWTLRKRWGLL
jgi:hypothetical protein